MIMTMIAAAAFVVVMIVDSLSFLRCIKIISATAAAVTVAVFVTVAT
jgi:hypothetical protein